MIYTLELRELNGNKEVIKKYSKRKQTTITEFAMPILTSIKIIGSNIIAMPLQFMIDGIK